MEADIILSYGFGKFTFVLRKKGNTLNMYKVLEIDNFAEQSGKASFYNMNVTCHGMYKGLFAW